MNNLDRPGDVDATDDPVARILTARNDALAQLVRTLRSTNDPVILYGAGATARHVYACLREQGVPVHGVAVDRLPAGDGEARFGDHPLLPVSALASAGRPVHCVLGFVPVAEEVAAIRRRLAAVVENRLEEVDFSGLSFGAASAAFVREHAAGLRAFSGWLADDLSRRTLVGYLQARLTYDPAWVADLYRPDQYFPQDVITLTPEEHLVDAGAYDGDTLRHFVSRTAGRFASIRAFEPDPVNFQRLAATVQQLGLTGCDLRNAGTWSRAGTLTFRAAHGFLSGLDAEGDLHVPVEAIDEVLDGGPVTFLKMDVEGAELASLEGARSSIRRCRPTLAICLYHRLEDLVTIPAWVREVLPAARLFLRLHTRHSQELVLYAVP